MPHHLVLGPRTRLGQALLSEPELAGATLLARSDDEAGLLPGNVCTPSTLPATFAGPVRVFVCALGPVHPETEVDSSRDLTNFQRDLGVIREVVKRSAPGANVVLASSVLALNPRPEPDRQYYTAWKQAVEAQLEQLVDEAPQATLSVVYPGRLVGDNASALHRAIHTPYHRLARTLVALGTSDRVLVGKDTRLWLARHRVSAGRAPHAPSVGAYGAELVAALG